MPMSTVVTGPEVVTSARWPVPEERRRVSVLFADIVGSTALVERLDPEDVRALQRAYFDTVAGVLRRWNGVVEKYVGDAVMALFGARDSDGFDAYRAVRAGLEIQRALDRRTLPGGITLRIRVGVATGEAVVDLAAARDGGHGTASGAVITTAARLQEYAPPGAVVVCAHTHRATAGLIDQQTLSPVTVAGKALPVDVWLACGPARPRRARHDGPLVGRRRELATARDQIVRMVRERRPRWVSLVGPAGSGRSRLLHELSRAIRSVDDMPVRWHVAHCPPYPDGVLAPVADMVRAFAGVREGETPANARRLLTAALRDVVAPAGLVPAVRALEELLARPDRSSAHGAAVWRRVLLELAARQPVVVAVDDLDRAAPELSRFLHTLFAAATGRGLPVAIVATHRPHWADLLPGPGDQRCRVALSRLGTVDTGRLLRHLLTRAGRPAALARALLPLVGGIPAVAEAYVRALDDVGPADSAGGPGAAAEPAVPEAVRRSIAVRLDRLDGAQRAVLMAGAALGGRFDAPGVERVLGWAPGRAEPVLRELAARDLVVRRPSRGGYAVAEPAVRRVAYERLPRTVRAEFARRAASGRDSGAARRAGGSGRDDHRAVPRGLAVVPAWTGPEVVDAGFRADATDPRGPTARPDDPAGRPRPVLIVDGPPPGERHDLTTDDRTGPRSTAGGRQRSGWTLAPIDGRPGKRGAHPGYAAGHRRDGASRRGVDGGQRTARRDDPPGTGTTGPSPAPDRRRPADRSDGVEPAVRLVA